MGFTEEIEEDIAISENRSNSEESTDDFFGTKSSRCVHVPVCVCVHVPLCVHVMHVGLVIHAFNRLCRDDTHNTACTAITEHAQHLVNIGN